MDEWNKLLSGDLKDRIKSGYMIIGENSVDFTLWTWAAGSEEEAVRMATHFSKTTGGCYEIIRYDFLGVIRPQELPIEYAKPKI